MVPGALQGRRGVDRGTLALEALSGVTEADDETQAKLAARDRAADWLVSQVESDAWTEPSPIGFYFAKLWYYEKLARSLPWLRCRATDALPISQRNGP